MSAPLLYCIAGEPSGDRLGGALLTALRRQYPEVSCRGIAGEAMQAAGCSTLFPLHDIALMGLAEILPHLRRLKQRLAQTIADIEAKNPAVLLTIDAPGFSFRVAKAVRALRDAGKVRTILLHYVAPSVWAWKPKRAGKMATIYDGVLCLLPFEPPYFTRHGLEAWFVGHPVTTDTGIENGDGLRFLSDYGLSANAPLLTLLPGSRHGEIKRLLPLFLEVAAILRARYPSLLLVLPTIPALLPSVREVVTRSGLPILLVETPTAKYDAWAASTAALAASGTVSVELAKAGLPAVIAYKVNPLTAALARRMIHVPYASLINLLLHKEVFPEYIQEKATVPALVQAVDRLLGATSQTVRSAFQADCAKALALMQNEKTEPATAAARVVQNALLSATVGF
jgi:lipid-A-disaccharide synthase